MSQTSKRKTQLVCPAGERVECDPSPCKSLVESNLLPHLEALLLTQSTAFNQSMDTSVRKAIFIAAVVETVKYILVRSQASVV